MNKKLSTAEKKDIIWKVSYKVLNCYLDFYREEGYKYTIAKSWEPVKWDLYGNVSISQLALEKFFEDKSLNKNSQAKNWGGKGGRCFVAEHSIPMAVIKRKYFDTFKKENPTYEEYKYFIQHHNRLCYVWHEEDTALNSAGLRSEVPNFENLEENIYERYKSVGIHPIQSSYDHGNKLFQNLAEMRESGFDASMVRKNLI